MACGDEANISQCERVRDVPCRSLESCVKAWSRYRHAGSQRGREAGAQTNGLYVYREEID